MKVKELVIKLSKYNQDAEFNIIVFNRVEEFTITFSGKDGCNKNNCNEVSLYLDDLCGQEGHNVQ
jgi:hypothetical protein